MRLTASDPDNPRRRKPLAPCPACGANGKACDSLHWLRGRTCCDLCTGDHDDDHDRGGPDAA